MSTYRASVRVDDGTLHVSRPLTAPEKVADLAASIEYDMANGDGSIVSVELVVETSDTSETPIGDSIPSASATPLPMPADEDDDELAPAGVRS